MTDNVLLDDVTTFNHTKVKPVTFATSLNFAQSGEAFLQFNRASLSAFKEDNTINIGNFYGYTSLGSTPHAFEISILDNL